MSDIFIELPEGSRVRSATEHGISSWSRTARIGVRLADETDRSFFLKVTPGESGHGMMHGEFESMQAIHSVTPDFVPKPIAWGTFKSDPNLHFFLCEYVDMNGELPDIYQFSRKLAAMHQNSTSPSGKFGFPITTYNGSLPQLNDWTETWEEFFANGLKHMLDLERAARGPSPDLDVLRPSLFHIIIPRLLRPLESGGRRIKPSLIHGDLWYGNVGTKTATN